MKQKLWALLLTVGLIASVSPLAVFADDGADKTESPASETVEEPMDTAENDTEAEDDTPNTADDGEDPAEPAEVPADETEDVQEDLAEEPQEAAPMLRAALAGGPLLGAGATGSTVASGTCGGNLTWTLDEDDVLTISGTGAMPQYYTYEYDDGDRYYWHDDTPWESFIGRILHVVIGEGVTSIGGQAFLDCASLESVTIASTVTSIGREAFSGCGQLSTITIPGSVTSVGEKAFYQCASLESVTILDGVKTIGEDAFRLCTSLTSVSIPGSVTTLYNGAFQSCGLTSVTLAEGINNIGTSTVVYSSTVWGKGAFSDCKDLTSITIPASVTTVGNFTFYGCANLSTLIFADGPSRHIQFGVGTCVGTTITELQSSLRLSTADGRQITASDLKINSEDWHISVYVPAAVIASGTCGDNANWTLTYGGVLTISGSGNMNILKPWSYPADNAQVTSIIIESGITRIPSTVFGNFSNLQSLTIPATLTSVGVASFAYCESLTDVYYGGSDAQWNSIQTDYNNDPLTAAQKHFSSHVFGAPVWSWAADHSGASARFVCACGQQSQTVEADEITQKTDNFTCTGGGEIVYSASVVFEGSTYTDTASVKVDAPGHDWGEWSVTTEPTSTEAGEEIRVCARCGETETRRIEPLGPIVISSQPADWVGGWGAYPRISVTVAGEGLIYQWYFRNAGVEAWSVSSDTDDCYDSYPMSEIRNGREVYCVITDADGNTIETEIAKMSYYVPEDWDGPSITVQPMSWMGEYGEYPAITVEAAGEELNYRWYFKDRGKTAFAVSSERDNCYDSYPLEKARDGRELYCVVTDKYGYSVQSDTVTMRLYIPEGYEGPSITTQPADWFGAYGEMPEVRVIVDGIGLTYRWYFSDDGGKTFKVSSETDDCYDSYELCEARRGRVLKCVVTDRYGNSVTSETAVMELYVPEDWDGPSVVSEPENWTGAMGDYPDITFVADGENLTYQWYFSDNNGATFRASSDKDNCYDSYPLAAMRNGRQLYCVATDKYGFTVSSSIVTMSLAN